MVDNSQNMTARRLQALLASLREILRLIDETPASPYDPGRVRGAVQRLKLRLLGAMRHAVLTPAVRAHRPQGVTFRGRKETCYSVVALSAAVQCYDEMMVITTGDLDDEYDGLLSAAAVARVWGTVAKKLKKCLRMTPAEVARLAKLVAEEHRTAQPDPPSPRPFVYHPPAGHVRPSGQEVEAALEQCRLGPTRRGRPRGAAGGQADAIAFVAGHPAVPFVTKIGGLPYRPAGLSWPRCAEGKPLTFVAQFCMFGSADLLGELPGDVLLLFARDAGDFYPSPYGDDSLRFEWFPLGLTGLVTAAEVPTVRWNLRPYYGFVERVSEKRGPVEGTKIGGQPYWIQADQSPEGRFLCTLGPIRQLPDGTVPAGRVAAGGRFVPQPGEEFEELSLGDSGLLHLFLAEDGAINGAFDCY